MKKKRGKDKKLFRAQQRYEDFFFFHDFFPRENTRQKSCRVFSLLFGWLVLPTSHGSFTALKAKIIWNFDKRKEEGCQTHRFAQRGYGISNLGDIQNLTGHDSGQSGLSSLSSSGELDDHRRFLLASMIISKFNSRNCFLHLLFFLTESPDFWNPLCTWQGSS